MPSLGSGYTFDDFLKRLERSPVTHMSPLYHEHRELFVRRPDMFSRAIGFLSWEKGSALIDAAYHSQSIDVTAYRALLARMLRHNRDISRGAVGSLVPWTAALRVHSNALIAHGAAAPARLTRSAQRLLLPHRKCPAVAAALLRLCDANGTAAQLSAGGVDAPLPQIDATSKDNSNVDNNNSNNMISGSSISSGSHSKGYTLALELLRRCTCDASAWRVAVPALRHNISSSISTMSSSNISNSISSSSSSSSSLPLPPLPAPPLPCDAASALVLQLRAARRPGLAVAVLLECFVPTRTPLSQPALEAMLECILAHTRAGAAPAVHWRTALGCATDVLRGGESTGPRPLSPRALSLLIHICVRAGSPEGALRAIGHARTADKTELAMSSEIRALLYCIAYDRPNEAEAIVRQAAKRHGEGNAQLLERLCGTAREAKRESGVEELSSHVKLD